MLTTLVAVLCLRGVCIDKVVTDQATFMQCGGAMAAQVIPTWMQEQGYAARGYTLAGWKCQIGARRIPA